MTGPCCPQRNVSASFGKYVEVIEPEAARFMLNERAPEIVELYTPDFWPLLHVSSKDRIFAGLIIHYYIRR